jgi:hypothetical protein
MNDQVDIWITKYDTAMTPADVELGMNTPQNTFFKYTFQYYTHIRATMKKMRTVHHVSGYQFLVQK